jgi:K+-transporting ATPase ATPase C chain
MAITRQLYAALKALLALTVLLGVLYPAAILAVGLVVPGPAKGSLIEVDGKVVGSSLLGQAAEGPQWFQARPSVSDQAGETSGGSNLGPPLGGPRRDGREARSRSAAGQPRRSGADPFGALTASGSGLDHTSRRRTPPTRRPGWSRRAA